MWRLKENWSAIGGFSLYDAGSAWWRPSMSHATSSAWGIIPPTTINGGMCFVTVFMSTSDCQVEEE